MSKSKKNVEGLRKHAKKRNQKTIQKVNKTINRLKRSKTKDINFVTVAEEAGVSKATLYNNDCLKERIMGLRETSKGVPEDRVPKDELEKKNHKIKQLYAEIKDLKEDKQKLIEQLIEMEELRDENKRLREEIKRLKEQSNFKNK
ncbi:DUF6262 family protein [Fuchsiella alkaliacetigena]|uniref:DUF6262 family protein n=1 Tax=Fuchsiella alkaliacetigena TaxID=957042 RepID=UPI00200B8D3F|nr:DUF6262 family protein [Fuchsiella alkaliacetigena]MCK8823898.1 DUF6262 family protein [Fuchsiella alkaliacetigena]